MTFGTTFANDELKLIYNGTAIANIADNAAASPVSNIYVAAHSADPSAGNQSTNEISYTGYARQAVARDGSHWIVTGNSVSPAADIAFPQSSLGTPTATHFSTGLLSSGAGKILDVGTITPNMVIQTTVPNVLSQLSTITRT